MVDPGIHSKAMPPDGSNYTHTSRNKCLGWARLVGLAFRARYAGGCDCDSGSGIRRFGATSHRQHYVNFVMEVVLGAGGFGAVSQNLKIWVGGY